MRKEGVMGLGCVCCRKKGVLKLFDKNNRQDIFTFLVGVNFNDFQLPYIAWVGFCDSCRKENNII